jgi:hypothetical protein
VIDTLTVGRGASGVSTNTAVGVSALAANTSGNSNTCVGSGAGQKNTTGIENTFIGETAGNSVTTGAYNVAVGREALLSLTSQSGNVAVGHQAGRNLTTGYYNVFAGKGAGQVASTVCIGWSSGSSITTGGENVCIGSESAAIKGGTGTGLQTGSQNVYIGSRTKSFGTSDANAIVIGYGAIGEGDNTSVIGNSSTVQQHFYATQYIKTEGSLVFASSTLAAIVANQNNYVLTGSAFQRLNCTTAADITGIAPPTGGAHVDGRMIRLVSVGTATVTLKHNDTDSAAANRMYLSSGNHLALAVNEWADLVYDSTDNGSGAAGWRVM